MKDECGNDVFGYDSSGGFDQSKNYAAGNSPLCKRAVIETSLQPDDPKSHYRKRVHGSNPDLSLQVRPVVLTNQIKTVKKSRKIYVPVSEIEWYFSDSSIR